MNWEYVNEYAWLTLGQVRTTPLPKGYDAVADREANMRAVQASQPFDCEEIE